MSVFRGHELANELYYAPECHKYSSPQSNFLIYRPKKPLVNAHFIFGVLLRHSANRMIAKKTPAMRYKAHWFRSSTTRRLRVEKNIYSINIFPKGSIRSKYRNIRERSTIGVLLSLFITALKLCHHTQSIKRA